VKTLNLRNLIDGQYHDLQWPPREISGWWATIGSYRLRWNGHAADLFADRTDLHDGSDLQIFTPGSIAREIASFSAALLFGEPPTLAARDPRDQPALKALVGSNRLDELLTVAGELVAVEGAGGLRVVLDDAIPGGVVIDYVSGDRILWRAKHGRFTTGGVIALEHEEKSGTRWRLLEDHDVGTARRRLFKGTTSRLGTPHDLRSGPEQWRELKPDVSTGLLDRSTLIKIENKPGGSSDFAGLLPLMDAFDDACTLIRMKMAASIPVVAGHESLFEGSGFAELWKGIVIESWHALDPALSPEKLVQVIQAQFDAAPMLDYLRHLRSEIISGAGYSIESFTGQGVGGRADSGRAIALRQTKTAHSRRAKSRMATRAISEALGVALAMYLGRSLAEANMPAVALADALGITAAEVAETQDQDREVS
jgi:hypothetical protein